MPTDPEMKRTSSPLETTPPAAWPITLRVAASSADGWHASANAEHGFLLLARGRGRSAPLAAALHGAIEDALSDPDAAIPAAEGGAPPVVRTLVSFLRAVHHEVRQATDAATGQGLEALIAIARHGRLHVIAAGGVGCLRRRRGDVELVAPLSPRVRPALGESPRVLIEVTSESLYPGDLLVAVPGGFEAEAPGNLMQQATLTLEQAVAWAETGSELRQESWRSPCAALYVEILQAVLIPEPDDTALEAPDSELDARVEIRGSATGGARGAMPVADSRDGSPHGELPSWLAPTTPDFAASEPESGDGPALPTSSGPGWRRQAPRLIGVVVIVAGLVMLVAQLGRMASANRQVEHPPAKQVVRAAAPLAGTVPLTGTVRLAGEEPLAGAVPLPEANSFARAGSESGAEGTAAPVMGSINARTEPFLPEIRVFVDDKELGVAPAALDGISPGRHRVRFLGAAGYSWEEEVAVRPGEASQVVARVEPIEDVTLVTVQASSINHRGTVLKEGLPVVVDGVEQGETPLDIDLDPGVHAIAIRPAAGPTIHRILDVRQGDRLILNVNLDKLPAVTLEHAPLTRLEAGDAPIFTVVRRGLDAPSGQPVHLHVEIGGRWSDLAMAAIPGAPGTFAVGVPLPTEAGSGIRYYFSTASTDGETVFTNIYTARVR